MAWRQGIASISVRRGAVVIVAGSIVRGARMDWRGIWHGLSISDFGAFHAGTDWPAPDDKVGALLRRALKSSRLKVPVPGAWANGLWSDKAEHDKQLAAAFGLSDAKRLYSGMVSCGVRWTWAMVTLYPTRRQKGGDFEGFAPAWQVGHEDLSVPFRSSDRDLGVAVRTCISRCL